MLVLQHPQEKDVELATAPLLALSLSKCRVAVGLSWPSLAKAWGQTTPAGAWAVVYPGAGKTDAPFLLADRHGKPCAPGNITGIVLLDGSWQQAKAIWWRNPWLLKLNRMSLFPREPSIYGRVRKAPRREALATLEAAAEALVALGEPAEVRSALRSAFRAMVQRFRDGTSSGDKVRGTQYSIP